MKKTISLSLLIFIGFTSFAQIQPPHQIKKQPNNLPNIQNGKLPKLNVTLDTSGVTITDITVYELPDQQGRSGYFKLRNGKLVPPFPVSNCSFTFPQGKIVYIKTFVEFPSELAYIKSQNRINLSNVTGIRSDDKTGIYIGFDGISTSIHNNDCRKVFGNINVKVIETSPDADLAQSFMSRGAVPGTGHLRTIITDMYNFKPFNFINAASVTESFASQYVYNNNPEPVVTHPAWHDIATASPTEGYFYVGRNALREGRVKILFNSNIASAHKTCDLCDDFSSNIKMRAPVGESLPIRNYYPTASSISDTTFKRIVLGPYEASGSRDGSAITATAGTIKQFRAYFRIRLYE